MAIFTVWHTPWRQNSRDLWEELTNFHGDSVWHWQGVRYVELMKGDSIAAQAIEANKDAAMNSDGEVVAKQEDD
ncbi:hypothetical protein P171DRAFT_207121 [Karstenula rhodostoma CBS 690.94]|uniref:Uncharacterized protein n=1 Tax=Karstenula rhodostoma CBS 690.94 TaxID=1392251 RepID=A0A9P4PRT2_9PLEO|nr:hypothetical protein P171DRAFT_207121 [Karstenula rhodostoma CBS 690.94]